VSAQDAGPAVPKQMRMVVGSAGGTGPDFIARLLAPKLGEVLKQTVIVDNRPSANGIAATVFVSRGPTDGSLIMIGNAGTHAINAVLYKKPEYDPVADFAPIGEIASAALVLVVHPSVPAKSVKELIAIARQSPDKLNVAIAGAAGELMGNAMKIDGKIKMTNVHYKGGGQALIAVLSGEADMVFTNYVILAQHIQSGRLRAIGTTGTQRIPQLPNVPTIAESAIPGYDHEQWYGLFAPARVSPALVDLMNREMVRIVKTPEFTERLVSTSHRVIAGTPQQLADKVKREIEKTRKIMRDAGMPQQ
jgi:tripartite-type tricarboxylate transporter receptor subunit TctC